MLPGFCTARLLGITFTHGGTLSLRCAHTHTHNETDTCKGSLSPPPPEQASTHPYSNWQLLLAHPSAEPLCSPAVFYQCNYSFGSGMTHWCGLMVWVVCFWGQVANFAVYLKEAGKMRQGGRARQGGDQRERRGWRRRRDEAGGGWAGKRKAGWREGCWNAEDRGSAMRQQRAGGGEWTEGRDLKRRGGEEKRYKGRDEGLL